jgi:hypothetical protein
MCSFDPALERDDGGRAALEQDDGHTVVEGVPAHGGQALAGEQKTLL